MRRGLIVAIVAAAALIAGCGSSKSSSAPPSPVATALSYIPANSPFVITAATTANPGGQALVNRLPNLALAETALFAKLRQVGIDYNADIRPLFGNPIAGGLVLQGASGKPNQFIAAWVTKDASKLDALIKKLEPGLQKVGTRDGATVYSLGELAVATDDATVVFASTQPDLNAALDRHAHGGGITPDDYSKAFMGLAQNSRLQVFGSLTQVLSMPSAAKAQSVPWVAALRGYAASINETAAGLTFQYRLDTSRRPLSDSDLPIASGSTAPNFAGAAPIVAAVRNPAQIFTFAENAERATNPAEYQRFLRRQAAVRSKTGVDLTSLIKLATGDLIIDSDTHTTIGRVQVSDPAAAKTTMAKLATHPTPPHFHALRPPSSACPAASTRSSRLTRKRSRSEWSATSLSSVRRRRRSCARLPSHRRYPRPAPGARWLSRSRSPTSSVSPASVASRGSRQRSSTCSATSRVGRPPPPPRPSSPATQR